MRWFPYEKDASVVLLASHAVARSFVKGIEVFLAWRIRSGSPDQLLGRCETAEEARSMCEADAKGGAS